VHWHDAPISHKRSFKRIDYADRRVLFGANTPRKRVRLTRAFGTRAASRAMKSNGSKMTWVVPSRYGVFSWYRTLPFGVSDRRFSAIAGRLIYRHSRSSFLRPSARAATPACSENPATLPTPASSGSSHAGNVCSVKTLRPCCGPTAMRYVIDEPRS